MTVHGSLVGSDMPGEYADDENNPSLVSMVYANAWEDLLLIRTLLAGARAIRAAGEMYLPKFELESCQDYATRVQFAQLSNYFVAAHRNIVSRPFTKAVSLQGEVTPTIRDFCEDVNGAGDDLHTFLRDVFARGVAFGRHGILVDYPSAREDVQTLEDERKAGARPYWAHVPADRLISCEEGFVDGQKRVTHARIIENTSERVGFKEVLKRRVRVLDHQPGLYPTWGLYEYEEATPNSRPRWTLKESGTISLPFIPMIVFTTGVDEVGRLQPPLIDLAHLQIEHYQQASSLKNILQLAGFPMLTGNGIQAPIDDKTGELATMTVGPRAVLFAPANPTGQNASWSFIEPQGTSIQRLMENIERLERDMAMAGMQPLMRQSGGVTATSEAINAARAHAAAEAWAMQLKNVAEQALAFTSIWYDEEQTAEVFITTEFGIELTKNNDVSELMLARDKNIISTATVWDEMKRRDFLGPQFDPEKEIDRVKEDPLPPPPISTLRGEGNPPGDGLRPAIGKNPLAGTTNIQANRPPSRAPSVPGRADGG